MYEKWHAKTRNQFTIPKQVMYYQHICDIYESVDRDVYGNDLLYIMKHDTMISLFFLAGILITIMGVIILFYSVEASTWEESPEIRKRY